MNQTVASLNRGTSYLTFFLLNGIYLQLKSKYLLCFDGIFLKSIGSKSTVFFSLKVKLFHYLRPQYKFDYSIKQAVRTPKIYAMLLLAKKKKKIIFFAFMFGPEDEGTFPGEGIDLR